MNKVNKITRNYLFLTCMYLFTFILPIFSQTLYGKKLRVSILGLNAGPTFFVVAIIFILLVILVNIFMKQYSKYANYGAFAYMSLLWLTFAFFKSTQSSLAFAFYFQLIVIALFVLTYLKPSLSIQIFDRFVKWILLVYKKIVKLVDERNQKKKEGEEA